MTKAILFYRNSLLTKLFMLVILLVGGGNSVWGDTVEELPYSYGFEDTDITTAGWTMTSTYTSTTTVSYPSGFNSTRCFKFHAYYGYNNQYIRTPEIESSSSGLEIKLYYNINWTSGNNTRSFYIGYTTDKSTEIANYTYTQYTVNNADKDWHEFTISIPVENVKYIAIKYTDTSYHFFIDNFSVSKADPHKEPISFSATNTTANSTTFTWTNPNNNAISWDIKYSTKENFDPKTEGALVNTTTGYPYLLEGLVDGTTYYASIRAIYSDGESDWSDNIFFSTGTNTTLNSDYGAGTSQNVAVPNYTNNPSYLTKSQMIYPNSELSTIKGKYITQLTFYANTSSIDWGTATYDIYMAETTTSSYAYSATFINWSDCIKVVEDTKLKVSDGKLVIDFQTPFYFSNNDDKNLLIGFAQKTVSASSVSSTWYAKYKNPAPSQYYCASYYNNGSNTYCTGQGYVPEVSIKYVSSVISITLGLNGYTTFACPRPLDLSNLPSGLKAYKAAVDGSTVRFTKINQTVAANTGILLEGTAEQTYNIPLAESGTAVEGNEFLVNSTGGTFTEDDGYTYFGMKKATSASDALVFATFAPGSVAIPTDKAYLKVENDPSGEARQLVCSFGDETPTGISATLNDKEKTINDEFIYNLNGQRVNKPSKGLYIVNGKKVIIK